MPRSKPNCPHCQNLGLDSKHWLRKNADAGSEIMCPVLLATECKYCHKTGHNVSKCSRLLAKKKADGTSNKTIHVNVPANSSYAAALRGPISISCSAKVENITVRPANPKQKKDVKHSWADDDYWASSDEE
jgi:hypothetical protein